MSRRNAPQVAIEEAVRAADQDAGPRGGDALAGRLVAALERERGEIWQRLELAPELAPNAK